MYGTQINLSSPSSHHTQSHQDKCHSDNYQDLLLRSMKDQTTHLVDMIRTYFTLLFPYPVTHHRQLLLAFLNRPLS